MMIDAAVQLERAGADFLVVTSNTGSSFAHNVADRIPLPILSIADTTSKAARTAGAHRLGVLSTIRTCESGLFQKAGSGFDVEFLAPRPDIAAAIDRLIFDELITGRVTQSGVGTVLDAIDSFRDMGADGIALACTDLTHLVPSLKGRTSLPLFDTTVLHAEAAAEIALGLRTL
jgi:aspartate racemase